MLQLGCILALSISLFVSINYYIGKNGLIIFSRIFSDNYKNAYWILFWIIAVSFLIGNFVKNYLPKFLSYVFTIVGAYWLIFMLYFFIAALIINLIYLVLRFFEYNHNSNLIFYLGIISFFIIIAIVTYGSITAKTVSISKYNITVTEKSTKVDNLKIAMVSDIHLGTLIGNKELKKMVDAVNSLDPDIVFICGDLIDDSIKPFIEYNMADYLKKLKSKYGVYSILGNHEYYSKDITKIKSEYERSGMNILMDQSVIINDLFLVVGRNDSSSGERKKLEDMLSSKDKSLPIILLDHKPVDIEAAVKNKVDIQLSGHTHRGQVFPLNLLTKKMYKEDWGILKLDNYNLIVSCGYGTWGPPVKIGSKCEIVQIEVNFSK